jgi:hypothetical protein
MAAFVKGDITSLPRPVQTAVIAFGLSLFIDAIALVDSVSSYVLIIRKNNYEAKGLTKVVTS